MNFNVASFAANTYVRATIFSAVILFVIGVLTGPGIGGLMRGGLVHLFSIGFHVAEDSKAIVKEAQHR